MAHRKIIIHKNFWYILEFTNLLKVRVLRYYFLNKVSAIRCISDFFPSKTQMFRVVKGSKVKYYINLQGNRSKIGYFSKYEYPLGTIYSEQSKKSYRTQFRRRLRRMGLLSNIKQSVRFDREPKEVRYIKNHQKVANCKRSAAKVFRLEHKPKHFFYILIKKYKSQREDSLFKVDTLRFSAKTGTIKKRKFHIKKKYLLIPYLIWDIENMIYGRLQKAKEHQGQEYYKRFGFVFHESKEKSVKSI